MAVGTPSTLALGAHPRVGTLLRHLLVVSCLLLGLGAAALPAGAHAAGGTPAVSAATADPPAFVPDWDGHTDTTVVRYTLVERSQVAVRIIDARGRTVDTIETGPREAGTWETSWDGRGSDGAVRPAGRYGVRVDARPAPAPVAAGEPGAAAAGGTVVVAGSRAATITLQRPPVAVRGVRLTRGSIGRSARASATTARFALSAPAAISAAIVDGSGTSVRTLATGRMRAGAHTLAWNGRHASGAALPDGDYALVVAASGAGRPTATTRLPLHVDRRLPALRATRSIRAAAASTGLRMPITVVVSEPSTLTVRAGRRTTRIALPTAGTHRLTVEAAKLGIVSTRRARTLGLRLTAVDAAGNAVAVSASVLVPPAVRGTTVRPPSVTPPTTGGGPGRLGWPVGGDVTSEFGLRWGRAHTGLDIAVPTGTPIHPAGPGTVEYVGQMGGYGNIVVLVHPDGMRTYYAHMSAFGGFGVGDAVDRLDVIGLVGCTGSCTGPHLHFETRVGTPPNDVPRDPRAFLPPR